jgi:hypothetical protein
MDFETLLTDCSKTPIYGVSLILRRSTYLKVRLLAAQDCGGLASGHF